jgi:hypothetical protein
MPEWLKRLTKTDIRNTISLTVVYFTFMTLWILMFTPVPESNHDIVNSIISFITGTALGGIIGYHFSDNKKDKKHDTEG